jgi:hypothetical protein
MGDKSRLFKIGNKRVFEKYNKRLTARGEEIYNK